MPKMFEFSGAQDLFKAVGITPGQDWSETRERIFSQARRQLRRRDIKPPTVVKWHRLATLDQ